MTLKKNGNLTEGVIWKQLLLFAIPLLIGNLFQQLYNTVDSVIVGNFAGNNSKLKPGDLVIWSDNTNGNTRNHVAVIEEVFSTINLSCF